MEESRIFLIDLGFPSETGSTLEKILNSCEELNIQIHQRNITSCEATVFDNLFSTDILNFDPHIIFLILSSNDLNQANVLLEFMREKSYRFPVIVVNEDGVCVV